MSDYLDKEYLRLDEEGEIGKAYLEVMGNVSIFEVENSDIKNTVEDLQQQLIEMRQSIKRLVRMEPDEIEDMIGWWENIKQRKRDIEAMKDLAKDQAKYAEGKLETKPVKTEQKLVKENELESYLAKGWQYVNSLNNFNRWLMG